MSDQDSDPRITAHRDDLDVASLDGTEHQLIHGLTNLHNAPDDKAMTVNQLLYGEAFTVYDIKDGWAWGQAARDGYVGYCRLDALSTDLIPSTHHVTNLSSHIYPEPDAKAPPVGQIFMMSHVSVVDEVPVKGFVQLADGNWIFAPHISNIHGTDPASEALKFLYAPYLWGGNSSGGIDCSGLVQLAFAATGMAVPRDSDQQAKAIGTVLPDDAIPQKGDIAFFPGHVGFMLDDMHLLHANVHHMRVSIDPLREVIDIVSFQTDEPPLTFIKRLAE
ncbi:MAG: C40 family peptidase [Alphaproteobacteria bacterium]|nr:C40 family peptidase [Alphaproteobacteria bacterium]